MSSLTKIVLLTLAFSITWLFPSSIDARKFVALTKQVSIKTNKNFPPHIAFEAVNEKMKPTLIVKDKTQNTIHLSTENYLSENEDPRPNAQKLVVNPITISKQKEIVYQAKNDFNEDLSLDSSQKTKRQIDNSWMQNLKPFIRQKISQLSGSEEKSINTKSSEAESAQAAGFFVGTSGDAAKTAAKWVARKVAASTSINSNTDVEPGKQNVSNISEALSDSDIEKTALKIGTKQNQNLIVGMIEIKDGLAVTNEHHIEVRRYEEGVFQERGTVNLIQGTYQLELQNSKGYILARLVTAKGKILGEGVARVTDVKWNKLSPHQGPKINITKKVDIKGQTVSAYNEGMSTPLPVASKGKVGVFKGYVSHELDNTGKIAFDNVVSKSSTNMVTQVTGHMTTQQIVVANSDITNVVYPQKMIQALKAFVSEQKQINYNDPNLSVIMGQIIFDKKPTSGIKVQIENYSEIEPVYFNSLMLPDSKLTTTSENGYFAFIGAPDELHHIVAFRGESYFGHINTKVDAGVVSYAKIESSIKTEQTEVKVYDAFAGNPRPAELTLQSLPEKIEVDDNGFQNIFMPSVERWSLLHANPSKDYQPAYYSYVDKTDYIYVPLISRSWLYGLVGELKINIYPASGIVMGFVHDEDFSVEIPNYENYKNNIIYFDYAGRITKQRSGTQGGGFIIFNLPTDIYEVLVVGAKSQKIYSRIAPVKAQDLFVFNFKLDN